jgi:hypothetical protein
MHASELDHELGLNFIGHGYDESKVLSRPLHPLLAHTHHV